MIRLTRVLPPGILTETAAVHLTIDQRVRSRLRVRLQDGREAGLFLKRGHLLRGGDLIGSEDGVVVRVIAAPERVSTVWSDDLTLLARAAYHLGNRHVPLQIEGGWLRYPHDHVLDAMLEGMGLHVDVAEAAFEPEAGAYQQMSQGHSHEVA